MKRLQARLGEISDLEQVLSLLHWDQNTMMPAGGGRARAAQLATLARVRHERLTAAETGELIAAAEAELGELAEDGVERRTVAEARRLYDKEARIPAELAEQMARAASEGYQLWVGARAENDFRAYAPALERNIELAREYAGCFDGYADPYDVLLDDYAPGMTSVQVGALFADLRGELVPLIDTLAGDRLALPGVVLDVGADAAVVGDEFAATLVILHAHPVSAAAADHEALQQRGSFARGAAGTV